MLNCKTPRRSLRQLDETRRRIEKFYNYCSQSAAHQFSFKYNFKKVSCDSWGQFFHASRLDMPFAETPTQHYLTYGTL